VESPSLKVKVESLSIIGGAGTVSKSVAIGVPRGVIADQCYLIIAIGRRLCEGRAL